MTKQISICLWLAVLLIQSPVRSLRVPSFSKQETIRYKIRLKANTTASEYLQIQQWLLANRYDVAGVNLQTRQIEVITNPFGIQKLSDRGLNGEIFIPKTNGGSNSPPSPAGLTPDRRYLNPNTIKEKLQALHQQFPLQTKILEIGKSHQGRSVYAMLVSTTPDLDSPDYYAKPVMIVDGLHHAREVMTPEVPLDFAEALLKANIRSRSKSLLSSMNFWIVPMVNPDGSSIVWTAEPMWRKNAYPLNSYVVGVDINRNYDYLWAACRGSSDNPQDENYHGPKSQSEPETQALQNLALLTRPSIYVSYHSYGELIIYPYGCRNKDAPDLRVHQKFAQLLQSQLPIDTLTTSTYRAGRSFDLLYPTDGASIDFMSGVFGALSFVIEVNQDFQPEYDLRTPTLTKQRQALAKLAEGSLQHMLAIQVQDNTGRPIEGAKIDISGLSRRSEPPLLTNRGGYFFKVIEQTPVQVTVTLANGRSQSLPVQQLGQTITVRF